MASDDFNEVMPHQIKIKHSSGINDYGEYQHASDFSTYRCLFDDRVQIGMGESGETVTIGRTAYVNTHGVDVNRNDKIEFMDGSSRPLVAIERHWDETGSLHSVTLRFE